MEFLGSAAILLSVPLLVSAVVFRTKAAKRYELAAVVLALIALAISWGLRG